MNKDLRDYGEEINKFHRRQKWGGVQHVDVVEGERENNWWQGERGRREWEGLYDGCDNWIGRMTKLVSILATLSEEKGFSNFCYLFILYCSSCKKLVSTYYPSFLFHFLGLHHCSIGLYSIYSIWCFEENIGGLVARLFLWIGMQGSLATTSYTIEGRWQLNIKQNGKILRTETLLSYLKDLEFF